MAIDINTLRSAGALVQRAESRLQGTAVATLRGEAGPSDIVSTVVAGGEARLATRLIGVQQRMTGALLDILR